MMITSEAPKFIVGKTYETCVINCLCTICHILLILLKDTACFVQPVYF